MAVGAGGGGVAAASEGPGDSIAFGDALALGEALADGDALAPGVGLEPTGMSGAGVPLGRTKNTGPLGAAEGDALGNGTGVGVAAPVARGVGGKSEPGPAGTGGIGMRDGAALAEGEARSLGYDGTAVGISPTPCCEGAGSGCCATSLESLENTKEEGVRLTDGFGGGVWSETKVELPVAVSVSMIRAVAFGSYLAGGGS